MEKAGASMLRPEQIRDSSALVFFSAGQSQREVFISIAETYVHMCVCVFVSVCMHLGACICIGR
jgi:hypothetical protein